MTWLIAIILTIILMSIFWMIVSATHPLAYWQPYRKWRGGGWGKCSSYLPGPKFIWVRVGVECDERLDEDYR